MNFRESLIQDIEQNGHLKVIRRDGRTDDELRAYYKAVKAGEIKVKTLAELFEPYMHILKGEDK